MTQTQKQNISRGVRAALELKRKMNENNKRSEAMKASWIRRRRENGALQEKIVESFTGRATQRQESLYDVAKVLGIDTDELVRTEIRKALDL